MGTFSRTPAVTCTFRIDPAALAVLELDARLTGRKLRARIRDMMEEEAEEISRRLNLPEEIPTEPALGRYAPRVVVWSA